MLHYDTEVNVYTFASVIHIGYTEQTIERFYAYKVIELKSMTSKKKNMKFATTTLKTVFLDATLFIVCGLKERRHVKKIR